MMLRMPIRIVESERRLVETTRDLDARADASAREDARGGERVGKNMKKRARATRASTDGRPCGNAACGTKVGVTRRCTNETWSGERGAGVSDD